MVIWFLAVTFTLALATNPRCPKQDADVENTVILYAHENDCGKYYACGTNGDFIELSCADGLHFNSELNVQCLMFYL